MEKEEIAALVKSQRDFFESGRTCEAEHRRSQLLKLKELIRSREDKIYDALRADLGRAPMESYFGELHFVGGELDNTLKNLEGWMRADRVGTPLLLLPATSEIYAEPYGLSLIIGPWNYPFQLLMAPLIGSMAAGNCAILKPSEFAPHTSSLIASMIRDEFEPGYIAVVEGEIPESRFLLEERFDYIFYTGNARVGKIIMEAAAKNLIPVTLELGGKSPCIVDRNLHMETVAKRITWGKFFNAGQTCVAPDYVLVQKALKCELLKELTAAIKCFYGEDLRISPHFGRIINDRHFARLSNLLKDGNVITGGVCEKEEKYIAPTIMTDVQWDSPLMEDEIFGPILPVMEYESIEDALKLIRERPKPLAIYLFTEDTELQDMVICRTSSGGVCINDTIVHLGSRTLPFGGIGESGMGAYHGRATFNTFSHQKSVMKRSLFPDPRFRYPPYMKLSAMFKFLMGLLG